MKNRVYNSPLRLEFLFFSAIFVLSFIITIVLPDALVVMVRSELVAEDEEKEDPLTTPNYTFCLLAVSVCDFPRSFC
jgi:hypothetical protein